MGQSNDKAADAPAPSFRGVGAPCEIGPPKPGRSDFVFRRGAPASKVSRLDQFRQKVRRDFSVPHGTRTAAKNVNTLRSKFSCRLVSSAPCSLHLIVLIFLLVRCCPCAVAAEDLPNWVGNPPPDTNEWIYGIGNGGTVEQTRQDALKNIAGKLFTNIKATTTSRGFSQDGLASRSFEEAIQTDVGDTKLANYDVIRTVTYRSGFFMLVRMSRPDFVRNTRLRLEQLNQTIESRARGSERDDKLHRLIAYHGLDAQLNQASALALLLQSADHAFDAEHQLSTYQRYRDLAAALQRNTRLLVQWDKGLGPVANTVAGFLSQAGYVTTSSPPADGFVLISGTIERHQIFSTNMILLNVTIETKGVDGTVLKHRSYRLTGSSAVDYDEAMNQAARNIEDGDGPTVLAQIGLE